MTFFFASDLHGSVDRYRSLIARIREERPAAVLLGGDLLPSHLARLAGGAFSPEEFILDFLVPELSKLRSDLGGHYPAVLIILGNDDARSTEVEIAAGTERGIWEYIQGRKVEVGGHSVYGYCYVPPTPFRMKDWERYDVSEFVDPGCLHPHEGFRTVEVSDNEVRFSTIRADLETLTAGSDLSRSVILFHSPPYRTNLDRAALDGKFIDSAPLDCHVGSVAVRELIEAKQPLVTLHGHVHESAGITGSWRDRIGRTEMFTAAHDGPELSLVRFSPEDPGAATRELL